MKILTIGDFHEKLTYPYAELIADGRVAERKEVVAALHKAAEDCDAVVFIGDNLDKRHNHSSVIDSFVEVLEGFGDKEIFIISGNHEVYEGTKTAIDFLKGMKKNWNVFTPADGVVLWAPERFMRNIAFVPYMTNASLGASSKEEATEKLMERIEKIAPFDAIFLHHAISGSKTDLFDEIVLPKDRLEKTSSLVVAGHIHQASVSGKTYITGNTFSHEVGDHTKVALKVDIPAGTVEQIPLPVRPIHKVINPTMKQLDELPKNAIVKAILTKEGLKAWTIKEALKRFDAHILVEDYPTERVRLHVDEKQKLDLSVPALLELYATARKKDPQRLKKAFALINEPT